MKQYKYHFLYIALLVIISACASWQKVKPFIVPIATSISKEAIKEVFDVDIEKVQNEVKAEKEVSYTELQKIFGVGIEKLTSEGGNQFWTKTILVHLSWVYNPDTKNVILKIIVKKAE